MSVSILVRSCIDSISMLVNRFVLCTLLMVLRFSSNVTNSVLPQKSCSMVAWFVKDCADTEVSNNRK